MCVLKPYQYIALSTLLLVPSAWDGFPLALCEAMICSVPVLSAECPTGPREILADGQFGHLVPEGDAQALAHAMAESLETTHDRAALMARAQHFSIDRAVDQYLRLLLPDEDSQKHT